MFDLSNCCPVCESSCAQLYGHWTQSCGNVHDFLQILCTMGPCPRPTSYRQSGLSQQKYDYKFDDDDVINTDIYIVSTFCASHTLGGTDNDISFKTPVCDTYRLLTQYFLHLNSHIIHASAQPTYVIINLYTYIMFCSSYDADAEVP